jgi:hypothetical protein
VTERAKRKERFHSIKLINRRKLERSDQLQDQLPEEFIKRDRLQDQLPGEFTKRDR